MKNLPKSKFLLLIPAVLIMLLIYPIGINTFLASSGFESFEMDTPGALLQLQDISRGFHRGEDRTLSSSIFSSMILSLAHVPYIWARTSVLPPYNFKALDELLPSLKEELIILMRAINLIAALGILLVCSYLIMRLCQGYLPFFLISLMIALNPNLMFQATVAYYECWAVFLVILSVVFFIKSFLEKEKTFSVFLLFLVFSALAVSCHERMAGYYILTIPFLIFTFFRSAWISKKSILKPILLTLTGLGFGFIIFCAANNVFYDGFGPTLKYFKFKSMLINPSPERLHSLLGFLVNQFHCQRHALWLVIFNLGFIVPIFSLCGIWSICKKRFTPAIALLLFPLGFQILSVGLPGWTEGRYIMGQTIFVILFAGFGIAWCIEHVKKTSQKLCFWVAVIIALLSQLFLIISVKILDNYYQPFRTVENIIKDPANKDKKILIQGMFYGIYPQKNIIYDDVIGEKNIYPNPDIIISNRCMDAKKLSEWTKLTKDLNPHFWFASSGWSSKCSCRKLYKKEFRNPPEWLVFLASDKGCYLFIQFFPIVIEWCDKEYAP